MALPGSRVVESGPYLGLLAWSRVCSEGRMWVCIAAGNENGINPQGLERWKRHLMGSVVSGAPQTLSFPDPPTPLSSVVSGELV